MEVQMGRKQTGLDKIAESFSPEKRKAGRPSVMRDAYRAPRDRLCHGAFGRLRCRGDDGSKPHGFVWRLACGTSSRSARSSDEAQRAVFQNCFRSAALHSYRSRARYSLAKAGRVVTWIFSISPAFVVGYRTDHPDALSPLSKRRTNVDCLLWGGRALCWYSP
jgi:hypothetical protein